MKAIVANLLVGSFLGASFSNYPALANPQAENFSKKSNLIVSAKLLSYKKLPINLDNRSFIKQALSIKNLKTVNFSSLNSNTIDKRILSLKQQPFTHHNEKENLILGFQNTFWPSEKRYWGLTTIEHFGKNHTENQSNLFKLNYTDEAPALSSGSAVLTVSGGGNKNLVDRSTNTLGKFEDFRGGVTYHQSLSNDVTVGVGFVYEDLLQSFSQFTYQSNFLPLRTTISLLTGEQGLEVHSHIRFKPSDDFVINYYNEKEKQRFDLSWAMLSGLNLTAKGNSQQELLSAGLNISAKNEYFALLAKAELNNNNNWNWQLNSQLGNLQLIVAANRLKTQSQINLNVLESLPSGFDCSLFFKYEIRQLENSQNNLTVWGGSLYSHPGMQNQKHRWKFDLGYGFGSQGNGAIFSTSIKLKPNLSLKLIYEEVSALSNDTNIKLQLGK